MIKVPLVNRRMEVLGFAIVDYCDADLAALRWSLERVGKTIQQSYARRGEGTLTIRLHAQIAERVFGTPAPGYLVDHLNRDGLDCRRTNLRMATAAQNARNSRAHTTTTSAYVGVSWQNGRKKWHATITTDRVRRFLGRFDSETDAAIAHDVAAIQLHGEFASLNFPEKRS